MALGLIQPLTEISTRSIFWGKGDRYVGLTTVPPSGADYLDIMGASNSWRPTGLSKPVMGLQRQIHLFRITLLCSYITLHVPNAVEGS